MLARIFERERLLFNRELHLTIVPTNGYQFLILWTVVEASVCVYIFVAITMSPYHHHSASSLALAPI